MAVTLINGLSEIAGDYDALICDVWGVLHNGRAPCPAASDALVKFHASGKPVVLFSNAPRLASEVQNQLDKIGVAREGYDAIITSGELARAELAKRAGQKIFHLGPERDRGVYEGLNIELVDFEKADMILCTGLFDDEKETAETYRDMLARAKARGLAFICANPDIVVQRGDRLIACAGAVARLYEQMGGKVVYYGKPYPAIYQAALSALRVHDKAARTLVVGDGVDTDIKGANGVGLDALFILDGIFTAQIPDKTDVAAIANLLNAKGVMARAVMAVLKW